MDLTFNCPECKQELAVEADAAGAQIDCPTCGKTITVPEMENITVLKGPPAALSAEAREVRHFTVPLHDQKADLLIQKPPPTLEVAAKDTDKKLRIKTIKHSDCYEVGKDKFDEVVSG